MPKLIALTRERRSERWRQIDYFIAQDHVDNPEEAMRKAIYDFLFTVEGKQMLVYSCGDYNWGDAIMSVTDEFWNKYGIQMKYDNQEYSISGAIVEITVNQDEVLVNDKHQYEN